MSEQIQRVGSAVLVQGAEALQLVYFALHAGVQKMNRDGVSAARLEQLKKTVRQALMSASGHEDAVCVVAEADSNCQDDDFWTVAEAADELGVGVRQVRRIAHGGLGIRKGRTWMLPKCRTLALKADREWKARNGSRRSPRD